MIIKEKAEETHSTNYAFACTWEMRKCLRDITENTEFDIPEMFRHYAKKLIEQAKQKSAG